jgi:hypothetical protein
MKEIGVAHFKILPKHLIDRGKEVKEHFIQVSQLSG